MFASTNLFELGVAEVTTFLLLAVQQSLFDLLHKEVIV